MDTSDIRKNLKLMVDGQPFVVVDFQFVKPGKGQSFTRVRIRNLETGNTLEKTWKSGEKIELADVEMRQMQYIYQEGENYVFMDAATGEQQTVPGAVVGDQTRFLADGMSVEVTLLKDRPIGVELPAHVELQIIESEPGVKGDTSSGASKPAKLSTGATVNVPLFINEGEWIRVDTRDAKYLERVKR
ncbi:MAG: elongation factor P [Myxococcales bacterium]|nr:elongation factor P [Myxococcales bacterium]